MGRLLRNWSGILVAFILLALMRLRQFGELLAEEAAASVGIYVGAMEGQVDRIRRLLDRGVLTEETARIFHGIRKAGNDAVLLVHI